MKKVLVILASIIFVTPLPITITACRFSLFSFYGQKYSDGILYKNHNSKMINDDRNGQGKLWWQLTNKYDIFHIREHQNINFNDLTLSDQRFINNCEKNMIYKASDKSISKFNELSKTNYYKDIDHLSSKIKPKGSPYNLDFQGLIDIALDKNNNLLDDKRKTKFADGIINFFNIITSLFGVDAVNKLIYELAINNKTSLSNPFFFTNKTSLIVATTTFSFLQLGAIQGILLGENVASEYLANEQYNKGYWNHNSILGTLVHEFGHAISRYIGITPESRKYLNNFDSKIIDPSTVPHVKNVIGHNPILGNKIKQYDVQPRDVLIKYIGRRVNISDNYYFQQRLAAWSFIESGYGRAGAEGYGGNEELFAEGFTQWLLTPDDRKALNWEILSEFYTSLLSNNFKK